VSSAKAAKIMNERFFFEFLQGIIGSPLFQK